MACKMVSYACAIILITLYVPLPIISQTVYWRSTTQAGPWVDKGTLASAAWDNDTSSYIEVDPTVKFQTIDGWGGAVNELGWDALSALSQTDRDNVIKEIFDTSGCSINRIRIGIGANDFSMGYYSCDDTPNDYQMNGFSLIRDKLRIIPFLKATLTARPDIKVWGSPWTPPGWMKTNNSLTGGNLKQDAQTLSAYALYFEKWVTSYQAEGIPVYAVMVQNEPNISNGYPSCLLSGIEVRNLIRDHLGPRFKNNNVKAEIWNVANTSSWNDYMQPVMGDSVARSYIAGVGLQWDGRMICRQVAATYPDKRVIQTEHQCGNFFWMAGYDRNVAPNDWNYGLYTFDRMSEWIKAGTQVYNQWNIVLDSTGKSWDNWPQNSMITIFKGGKTVRYNPQFYAVKHFSYYVKPGASLISTQGNFGKGTTVSISAQYGSIASGDAIAFANPGGIKVILVRNSAASEKIPAIRLGKIKFKPTLPANSINTFTVLYTDATPITRNPYDRIEAELFSSQSGVQTETCNEGGQNIGYIENGDWSAYSNLDFGAGADSCGFRIASGASGTIEIRLGSPFGTLIGSCAIAGTGGWQNWQTVSCKVNRSIGVQVVYLVFTGGSGYLINLNWLQFVPLATLVRQEPGAHKPVVAPTKEQRLEIFDARGRLVAAGSAGDSAMSAAKLTSGIRVITLTQGGKHAIKRIVVR